MFSPEERQRMYAEAVRQMSADVVLSLEDVRERYVRPAMARAMDQGLAAMHEAAYVAAGMSQGERERLVYGGERFAILNPNFAVRVREG